MTYDLRMPKKTSKKAAGTVPSQESVIAGIRSEASQIRNKILHRKTPSLKFPIRSLSNVIYQPKKGYFQIKGRKKERTLTVGTVKTFAQTLRMMAFGSPPSN